MPKPFIIWASTRTSSTNLAEATGAENEPFHFGPPPNRLHFVYAQWLAGNQGPEFDFVLRGILVRNESFKHLPEWFADGFNMALARSATSLGYRHIHLIRLNELDRLVSNDIAGQLDAWWPKEADDRFAELRSGERHLNPLDVTRLIENARRVRQVWRAVEPHLAPVLTLTQEDLTSWDVDIRGDALRRLAGFLGLPGDSLRDLDLSMQFGGQKTVRIRDLVPNVGELRQALMTEGLA